MKKQVSFKKELLFKTRVSEITSISLEHNILKKEDGIISGEFVISGEYKLTEGSINREKYNFNLPFDIALNSKYDIDSAKIDIDNFYYDILGNQNLSVDIELVIYADETINTMDDDNIRVINDKEEDKDIEKDNDIKRDINIDNVNINTNTNSINNDIDTNIDNNIDTNIESNIFNNINEETYKAYYVYIVREDDTIDKILDKYNVTKEDIELYNDISDIKVNDKIIIPYDTN